MKLTSVLISIFFSLPVQAGVFVGNGGEGILKSDGTVELRDFYESQIPERDLLDANIILNPEIEEHLN
jgi:hypothetical protein